MEESQVSEIVKRHFSQQGYKIHPEVPVGGINREIILDFYCYKDTNPPSILWVECKGDVGTSQLLEGFIRLELAIFYGGGKGVLAIPNYAYHKLMKHRDFLRQAEEVIRVLNVEKE